MKKIYLLFIACAIILSSCSPNTGEETYTLSDPNGIANQNNATDDMFSLAGTYNNPSLKTAIKSRNNSYDNFTGGLTRVDANSGILGTWKKNYNSIDYTTDEVVEYTRKITFNSNGTYSYYAPSPAFSVKLEGTYELYKKNDNYFVIINYGERIYDLMYFCSDNYLCFQKYNPFE